MRRERGREGEMRRGEREGGRDEERGKGERERENDEEGKRVRDEEREREMRKEGGRRDFSHFIRMNILNFMHSFYYQI